MPLRTGKLKLLESAKHMHHNYSTVEIVHEVVTLDKPIQFRKEMCLLCHAIHLAKAYI